MKLKIMTALLCFIFMFTVHSIASDDIDKRVPKAVLTEQIFAFKPVVEGTTVTHDFILQNRGTAPLVIQKIKTG